MALWLLGSGLAWLTAQAGIELGLGTALIAGTLFGLAGGRRVDRRRLRALSRSEP